MAKNKVVAQLLNDDDFTYDGKSHTLALNEGLANKYIPEGITQEMLDSILKAQEELTSDFIKVGGSLAHDKIKKMRTKKKRHVTLTGLGLLGEDLDISIGKDTPPLMSISRHYNSRSRVTKELDALAKMSKQKVS